jgi:hypothetical protein
MASVKKAVTRPLLVRPGARFSCLGYGLCCTDIHLIGPLTRAEAGDLRLKRKSSVVFDKDIDALVIRVDAEGRCVYLSERGCEIHLGEGHHAKPVGCRRFPYGLIATPLGGRVTTDHRCPCRILGERPPLSLENAERSLRDRSGRLETDRRVGNRVRLTHGHSVSFPRYARMEASLLARLQSDERAEKVLAAKPLPALAKRSWSAIAIEIFELRDASAGGVALAWFGDALLELAAGYKPPKRSRPWSGMFSQAMAEHRATAGAEAIWNDWVADVIWMLRFLPWAPFDVARAELATRLAVARLIQKRISKLGVPAAQAAAEAVMICELTAENDPWQNAVRSIATHPSPADELIEAIQPAQ